MARTLTHRCRAGGEGQVVRDDASYDAVVWRCSSACGTYFLVVDGGQPTEAK